MTTTPNISSSPVDACPWCHRRQWWRSIHGRVICARCHAPATPNLVAEWIGAPEGDGSGPGVTEAAWQIPAELPPERVVVTVDSREQRPLNLKPLKVIRGTLSTGDYAVGTSIVVERKSREDLLDCFCRLPERFQGQCERLLSCRTRLLVVEASWRNIEQQGRQSKVSPSEILDTLLGWLAKGLPIVLAGDHKRASVYVRKFLYLAAAEQWEQTQAMVRDSNRKEVRR